MLAARPVALQHPLAARREADLEAVLDAVQLVLAQTIERRMATQELEWLHRPRRRHAGILCRAARAAR
jgi:hypothetical protein